MREILFKAKRTDNGEWVEGFYCKKKTGYYDNIGFHEQYKDCIIVSLSDGGITWVDIDPETLCQYTGLNDKNGKKIWENDILKFCDRNNDYTWTAIVKFGNPNAKYNWGWQIAPVGECEVNTDILLWVGMESTGAFCNVIGNIFDNPELLEGSAETGQQGNQDLLMPAT